MSGVWRVLSVNVVRSIGRPSYVIMTVGFMIAAILAAVLFSSHADEQGAIAYVVAPRVGVWNKEATDVTGVLGISGAIDVTGVLGTSGAVDVRKALERMFRVEVVDEAPPMSQLLRNRYAAVVMDNGVGRFDIVTIKGEMYRNQLERALSNPETFAPDASAGRGIGATIVGHLVMFVLLSGSSFMNFFTNDKTSGTFRRTVTAPVGVRAYLAGQLLFNALMLFIPVMCLLVVVREVFLVDIGFSYLHYALLLGLLTTLATAFGFFMASVIENADNSLAVASSVIIVTSLLGGAFYAFHHDGALMQFITGLLPQTSLMQIAHGLEQGWSSAQLAGPAGYVVAIALALCVAGWIVCERRFKAGMY